MKYQFEVNDRVRVEYPESILGLQYYAKINGKVGKVTKVKQYPSNDFDGLTIEVDGDSYYISSTYVVLISRVEQAPVVNVGDRVRCIKYVMFMDGSEAKVGDEFTVDADDRAYFSWAVENGDYVVLPKPIMYRVHCTSYGSLTGQVFETLRYEHLADAIARAYDRVDEYGWNQATVHADVAGPSVMLFGAFRNADGSTDVTKTADCNVSRAEIVAALQRMTKE